MNLVLYGVTVLIWGTTWIAIKWQLGAVAVPVSIFYRFAIAGTVMLASLICMRRPIRPPAWAWRYLVAQGLALFCCNFLCLYFASQYIASGLVAVIFSTAPLWNALNGRLLLNRPIRKPVIAGAACGLAGIGLLFLPSLAGHWRDPTLLTGLGLALLGTLCFSIGNVLSSEMQSRGLAPWMTTTWAMLIGAAVLGAGSTALGYPFAAEAAPRYIGALLYLAIPGSVIGFTAYLVLVGRIGADRAAYCTVLFPVVALTVSTFLEGYRWTPVAIPGVGLIFAGNLLAFLPVHAGQQGKLRSVP